MAPLLQVHIENYRSLRNITVPLGALNVLVGPNAAGKSNFLDVLEFLGDSVRMDLRPSLEVRGGYERVRFRGKSTGPIRIEIQANVTRHSNSKARDVYELTVSLGKITARREGLQDRRVLLRRESFKFKRTAGAGRRITISGRNIEIVDETARGPSTTRKIGLASESLGLATLPRLAETEGGAAIRAIAEMFASFRVFDVDVHEARQPTTSLNIVTLESNARNLAGFLYWLSEEHAELFDELQDDARHFVPGLRELKFEPVGGAASAVALNLSESGLKDPTSLADASFGTVRALALLALLYDPYPPPLTCVEEVDHGLHPYVFDRLVERLREASERTQLLIATHSPALVNRLDPRELIVVERQDDGSTRMPAVSADDIRRVEEAAAGELGLGEIWFSGTLGGVPD